MKLWLNGRLVEATQARIDPADRGFLLGDGVFETMVGRSGRVPELARHYTRLKDGAALLRLPVAITQTELALAIEELMGANGVVDAALRLTVTRGVGPRGVLPAFSAMPTILLTASPLPEPALPARLIVSSLRRDETSPLSRIKSLNYLPNILARLEADEQGADDALLLNHEGRVAEASAASLFVYQQGQWVTPPVSEGALPGICRAVLLAAGKIQEARVSLADLHTAQALCVGNALSLRPVLCLGDHYCPERATP